LINVLENIAMIYSTTIPSQERL